MAYDTAIFEGCEGLFFCLGDWVNTVTFGMFWSIILIAFGLVVFMGSFNFGTNRAFGYASLSMGFVSLIFVQLGFIPTWILTLSLVLAALGVVVMLIQDR